jgi:amidase
MTADLDLCYMPATEIAARIRSGALTAARVVENSLARIAAVNPKLNCFCFVYPDEARAIAAELDREAQAGRFRGPLHGVPFAMKDLTPTKGKRTTLGSYAYEHWVPDYDAPIVEALNAAGGVMVGKTTTPEFAYSGFTESPLWGITRNPWDPTRTPGGSSGGSAAAVAAGMVPVAHGNDGGGSLRIPAACCGLVGLKPSRGRVSRGPDMGDSYLACDGVLTRTVAESAQLLDVLAGYEVGDATWAPRPAEPYSTVHRRDPGRLRIAMTAQNALGVDVDPECMHGLREGAELLTGLGHEVVEAAPALPGPETAALFTQVFGAQVSLGISYGELLAGRSPDEDEIEPLSRAIHELAQGITSVGYLAAAAQLQALARGVIAFFAEYDLLLTPALAERPLPIGELNGLGEEPLEDFARSGRFTPFTALFNVTGQPAASVPVAMGEDGLPTSVQLVAKPLGEDTLLQVLAQIEAARPWAHRRPPMHALERRS